jgi:hypothetical protein
MDIFAPPGDLPLQMIRGKDSFQELMIDAVTGNGGTG